MKKIVLTVVLFMMHHGLCAGSTQDFLGTWVLSYRYAGELHTDKMVLDEFYFDDDRDGTVTGTFFPDVAGSRQFILCTDGINRIDSAQPMLYCETIDRFLVTRDSFQIDFSGDVITLGYYSTATGFSPSANDILLQKTTPVTGQRALSNAASTYSDDSELLIIPSVNYQGSYWKVMLKLEQNGVFSILFAEPTNDISDIIFNRDTFSQLTIPSVIYNGQDYRVVLVFTEDGAFNVFEITLN